MSRMFMFFLVGLLSLSLPLFGCGASVLNDVETTSVSVVTEPPIPISVPPSVPNRTSVRVRLATSVPQACDTHRARFVIRAVSTRDGMRVYCF